VHSPGTRTTVSWVTIGVFESKESVSRAHTNHAGRAPLAAGFGRPLTRSTTVQDLLPHRMTPPSVPHAAEPTLPMPFMSTAKPPPGHTVGRPTAAERHTSRQRQHTHNNNNNNSHHDNANASDNDNEQLQQHQRTSRERGA
jgi:hypothetical protein